MHARHMSMNYLSASSGSRLDHAAKEKKFFDDASLNYEL